ncbi:MAG TPA: acyl-CoA dehydrogenase family protein [Thermoanaerobaculia bacterium]|nr:acyl-CoA dehydrogenase family protein [Thermoanaerobaculia bacterium]
MAVEAPARSPSFVKSLYSGAVDEETLFPYPEIREDERETVSTFLDSFRQFAAARVDPAKIERAHAVGEDVIRGISELGLMGMAIPEEYGGFGFSSSAYCRTMEEITTADASLAIVVGAHQSIGCKGLVLFGTEEQKRRWLPKLATGELIAAFALTEPEAGSDAAAQKTTAVYDAETDTFVVNGTKQWISNGGFASFFTVFARDEALPATEPHRKITAFAVTSDLPGLARGKEENKLGLKGSSTCQIHFENMRVPAANVLGERGQGFKIAVEVLNTGRTSLGAGCVGGSKAMLRAAALHATQRKQFQTPIARFEMIRAKFARMVVETYALESMVYLTTGRIDGGAEDYALEGACCKVFGTEVVWKNINDALQIAGGNGFMEEYPYEKALRDSRINMIFEGTNEILRMLIALSGARDVGEYMKDVGKALKAPLSSLGVISGFAGKRIRRAVAPGKLAGVAPELAPQGESLVRYTAAMANAVETLLRKYGKGIIEKEYQQERLANATIDLYAGFAVLSRATAAVARKGAAKAADEIRLAKTFVRQARHRIVGNLKEMDRSPDADLTAISETAYAAGGYAFGWWE